MNASKASGIFYSERKLKKILDKYWYYKVEYEPGKFTPGQGYLNVALTRELLRNTDVKGHSVLDLGTMEGIIPALLSKRGAKKIDAVDVLDSTEHIDLVKNAYDAEFSYHPGLQSDLVLEFFKKRTAAVQPALGEWYELPEKGFDIVVSSGMLYHVFSPLHILGMARSLVKKNGLMIIESAVIDDERLIMQHNFAGKDYAAKTGSHYFYGWSDTWFISVPMMDYMLRFLKLTPVDCVYFPQINVEGHKILRMAVACKPSEDFVSFEGETILKESSQNMDYKVLFDDTFLANEPSKKVTYKPDHKRLVLRKNSDAVNLLETVRTKPGLELTPDSATLKLADLY